MALFIFMCDALRRSAIIGTSERLTDRVLAFSAYPSQKELVTNTYQE